jgi:DNA modification methylase
MSPKPKPKRRAAPAAAVSPQIAAPEPRDAPVAAITELPIERVARAALRPHPQNYRHHPPEQLDHLVASLREHGIYRPVVVARDNTILAGHGLVLAAERLGIVEMNVVRVDVAPDSIQALKLLSGDNELARLSEDSNEALAQILQQIRNDDLAGVGALIGTGYTDASLASLIATLPQADIPIDEVEVPEPPLQPRTVVGDRIRLGRHLLVCGDARDATAWTRLLVDAQVDAIWTDPPYGVSYVGKTKDALTIDNDSLSSSDLEQFLRAAFALALVHTKDGGTWYVAAPPGPTQRIFDILLCENGVMRQCLSWVKDQFVMGRSDYHYRHEPIFYGWKPGAAHTWHGGRSQDSVLEIARPRRSAEHPTMKPVALVQRCIENSTDYGALVGDPFAGSGTTLLACELAGRAARCIELSPAYCDVIVARWEKQTGRTAHYESAPLDLA